MKYFILLAILILFIILIYEYLSLKAYINKHQEDELQEIESYINDKIKVIAIVGPSLLIISIISLVIK